MPNFFYTDVTGQKRGPVNDQQLKALAAQGIITPQTPLETDTGHKGQAGQIQGLFAPPAPVSPFAATTPQSPPQGVPTFVANGANAPLKPVIIGGIVILVLLLIGGVWWVSPSSHPATEEQAEIVENPVSERGDANVQNNEPPNPRDTIATILPDEKVEVAKAPTESSGVFAENDNGKNADVDKDIAATIPSEQAEVDQFCEAFGTDVKATDEKGLTLLHKASAIGNITVVKHLVAKGADVNAKAKNGHTPLHMTGGNKNAEVAEFLVSQGADVNAKNHDDWTPLHGAAYQTNIEVVKFLISKGAEVNAKTKNDRTPLCETIQENKNIEVIEYLISKGADINIRYDPLLSRTTPLHEAAMRNAEIVKCLVSHGARLNVKDKNGNTPLHNAITSGNIEVIRFLVSHGADLTMENFNGKTPLAWAQETKKNVAIIEYLSNPPAPTTTSTRSDTELSTGHL